MPLPLSRQFSASNIWAPQRHNLSSPTTRPCPPWQHGRVVLDNKSMLSGRECRVSWHQIICLSIIIVGFLVVSRHLLLFICYFFVNFAHEFLRWYQFRLADGWVRNIYMESVYSTLCSWHLGISQNLHSGQRQSNSRCLWVCFADILCLCLSCSARWVWCIVWIVYMHISGGFCVARSDYCGQCESLEVWDG